MELAGIWVPLLFITSNESWVLSQHVDCGFEEHLAWQAADDLYGPVSS
jgi:hypothetical protein